MEGFNQAQEDATRQDLLTVLAGLRRTNGHLLSPAERGAIQGIKDLPRGAGRLLARLLLRRHACIRLEEFHYEEIEAPEKSLRLLVRHGFLITMAHSPTRCALFTCKELSQWCRIQGVESKGNKAALVARVSQLAEGPPGRAIHVVHRKMVDWCEWIFFGGLHGSRSRMLLGRLGKAKWADYHQSTGFVAFDTRDELRAFLAFRRDPSVPTQDLVRSIEALVPRMPSHKRFDLRRMMGEELLRRAVAKEADNVPGEALALYRSAARLNVGRAAEVKRRQALCMSALGDHHGATVLCQSAVMDARDKEALALARTGRRMARLCGLPWLPGRPLRKGKSRTVGVRKNTNGWGEGMPIEAAVIETVKGRDMVHAEGRLWTSLFGLLFFDLLWLPVPGMLPVACLAGPLDLGRPGFRVRRREAFDKRIRALAAGRGQAWVKKSLKARGVRIRGLDWELATDRQWQQLVACLPGEMLSGTMRILGEEGFGAASGLPDLFLWPGKAQRLPFSFPQKLQSCAMLVEVKGPGDDLKDNQRVWHDRLVAWNFPIEVWQVEELDSFYAHHRRTVERTKIAPSKGSGGAPNFRPGPGGTLFDLGAGVERVHGS